MDRYRLNQQLVTRARGPLLGLAALAGLASLVGFILNREQFHFSYHVSFIFFLSLSLGATFFVMLQYVTSAGWSVTVRRLAETVMANLWLLGLLFIPVALGVPYLFHWSHADVMAQDHLLQKKAAYLNVPFFLLRAGFYLLVWFVLSRQIYRHSTAQDADGNPSHAQAAGRWSAPGIAVLIITATFAAFDWLMSLDAHWYSTIFGIYFFAGAGVAAIALLIVIAVLLRRAGLLTEVITTEHYHDLGKLLFAFTVFWTYIAFSQYFLIWYANLPEETIWFQHRLEGSWRYVSLLILLGHFVLPFLVLLARAAKRNLFVLTAVALWMLVMHYVDIYWMVMPTAPGAQHGVHFHWLDLTTLIALGSLLAYAFLARLSRHALVPVRDEFLAESLSFENV